MKKLIALVLVMSLVFGVTYITQFTGSDVAPKDDKKESGVGPLLWGYLTAKRDATSDEPHYRYYPGFFEVNVQNSELFWFRNEKPVDVTFGFGGVSCARCTNARVAILPSDAVDRLIQWNMLPAALPIGLGAIPTFFPTAGMVELLSKLEWTDFGVDKLDLKVKVPAATPGRPTWGVVRVGFRATTLGPNQTAAFFNAQADGAKEPTNYTIHINMMGVDIFEVTPKPDVDVGDLVEGARPRNFNLYFWSVIRSQAELTPPVVRVGNDDPFVVVHPPVPLSVSDLDSLADKLGEKHKELGLTLKAGYRIPVTVLRDAPGKLPDIGIFEKDVYVSGQGDFVQKIAIKGRVTGLVWLQDAESVVIKPYSSKLGTETKATLVTGQPNLDLELVPDEKSPSFLQAALSEP
ncbi:MAG TPA: hypothetical protein VGJ05_18070, partial [Fimbriiglobus sp.]